MSIEFHDTLGHFLGFKFCTVVMEAFNENTFQKKIDELSI